MRLIRHSSTGTLRYFEDFNTPGTLAQPTFSRTPNFNCTYSFASFFNARFKTQYDFAQIDSIYFELTGAHVNVCADNCSLTCDTLQKLNQQFLGGYDSLVNTACTGTPYYRAADSVSCCQKNFAKFVNAKLHTSFSYQDIIGAYSVCGVNLVSCAPPVNGNTLCGRSAPVFAPVTDIPVTNCTDSAFFAVSKGTELYNAYSDSLVSVFDSSYRSKCMQAYKYESFTVTDTLSEYHYTLYYYDQAGNLVKTIPPEGVDLSKFGWLASWRDSVNNALALNQILTPGHWLPTQYRYNTLNQVTAQHTPDAGESYFWYDRLGRLSISENARQRAASGSETNRLYSYTLYDVLGRITEVGEIKNAGTAAMTDSISRAPGLLANWLAVSVAGKSQVTQTVYDLPYAGFTGLSPVPLVQQNLRNRVSYTTYTVGNNAARFNQASYYSYDIHGNVDTLLQDYDSELNTEVRNPLNALGNRFKRMVYQYDLISGKVNQVAYQPGAPDQFFHRYSYDAENRLVLAETSADSLLWERDARYQYYKHGPLARLRLGDQLVQGLDYAYTLQGWLKGVNGTSLDSTYDMGLDGRPGENQYVARDAYGFVLNYFSGDYNNISSLYKPFPGFSSQLNNEYRPLFNGNISSQAVNIPRLGAPLLYNYRYDQLNRLVAQDGYSGLNPAANRWDTLILSPAYRERIAYDANGNILKYLRNGMAASVAMDSLQYYYNRDGQGRLLNNKLAFVRDSVNATSYGVDIDNQPLNNYAYDPIGNLIKDSAENISKISWNVYGKITEIQKTATASNLVVDIKYFYDAGGNRIGKAVKLAGSDSLAYSWYVRDASGNVMALYESRGLDTGYSHYNLFLTEQHLYGSSRLGLLKRKVDLTPGNGVLQNSRFIRGNKFFELSNHLGNVLAIISDKKTGVSSNGTTIDYYRPELITAQDYYPFGMLMPGRSGASTRSGSPADETGSTVPPANLDITSRSGNSPVIYQAITSIIFDNGFASSSTDAFETIIGDQYTGGGATGGSWVDGSSGYRYGFNGQEKDEEIKGSGNSYTAEFWEYDPRLGRRWNIDPIQNVWQSPYSSFDNSPIALSDPFGAEANGEHKRKYDKKGAEILDEVTVTAKIKKKEKLSWNDIPTERITKPGFLSTALAGFNGDVHRQEAEGFAYGRQDRPNVDGVAVYDLDEFNTIVQTFSKIKTINSETNETEEAVYSTYSIFRYGMYGDHTLDVSEVDFFANPSGYMAPPRILIDPFVFVGGGASKKGLILAGAKSSEFSLLRYASKYGIASYEALRGSAKGAQVHHLIEKRFAYIWGEKQGKMLSIILSKAEHIKFTTLWRLKIPYGQQLGKGLNTATATKDLISNTAKEIYKNYPEILKALNIY